MTRTLAALLAICSTHALAVEKLTTESYVVTIEQRCPEGNVTCDNVTCTGVHRKTGKSISLKGSTVHSTCADRVTPCRFLGYSFRNGDVKYAVWEGGQLVVTQGDKVLLQESGTWE